VKGSFTTPTTENPTQLLDKRRRRHWRRTLLGGIVSRDRTRLGGWSTIFSDFGRVGNSATWCAETVLLPHAGATTFLLVIRGRLWLPFVCLQRTTTAGVAMQSSVRRGTTFKDGACSIGNRGRLGLQRFAAGRISMAGPSRCGTSADAGADDFLVVLV
jgi:hypothetical protein